MSRTRPLLLALFFVALPGLARAGGWTQPPRGYYVKLETARRQTDRIFDLDAHDAPYSIGGGPARYSATEVRAYAEYGLRSRLTGLAAIDWKRARVRETAARYTTTGFGDVRFGLRLGLSQGGSLPTALQLEVGLPAGYDRADVPALGGGHAEGTLSAQVGHSFRGGYVAADAGYRTRGGPLIDQVVYGAELGLSAPAGLVVRLALRARSSVQHSTAELIDPAVAERNGLAGSGTLVVPLRHGLDLETGIARAFRGSNTLRGVEISLGVAAHR